MILPIKLHYTCVLSFLNYVSMLISLMTSKLTVVYVQFIFYIVRTKIFTFCTYCIISNVKPTFFKDRLLSFSH